MRAALAARHDVRFEEIAIGSGADGIVDLLSQAVLEPGDEVVCGWPSFPSYAIYAVKTGAVPVKVPLRDDRYDLDALLEAVTQRTKIVYVCNPNNPTGTMNTRAELEAYFERVPPHVLTVVDRQALPKCGPGGAAQPATSLEHRHPRSTVRTRQRGGHAGDTASDHDHAPTAHGPPPAKLENATHAFSHGGSDTRPTDTA